jgi:hypothetical protein
MVRLPQSPRARRRVLRFGLLGAAVGAVALVASLVPNHRGLDPEPTRNEGPASLALATRTRVATTDRQAIDRTLDRFLPAALTRRDPATAWALAGPELRSGSSLSAWKGGTSPVPYYPVLEKTFHTWRTIAVEKDAVILNLLVHAKPSSGLGSYVFSTQVVKQHGRWLVNRIYTIAIMNPPKKKTYHEIGPADFVSPPAVSRTPSNKARIGHIGILPVVLILGLVLALPLSFAGIALVRARRWRRLVQTAARTELPPLPDGYRTDAREDADLALRR